MACILCDDKGYRGIDAYGAKVPCDCMAYPPGPALTDEQREAIRAALTGPCEVTLERPMQLVPALPLAQVVRLRPGDRVVLQTDKVLDEAASDRLRRQFADFLGGDVKVAVLEDGVRLTVLSPDDPGAE